MTGRLVAEFRYGTNYHTRATKIGQTWWFRVRLGKKRMLVCDCGGLTKYYPDQIEFNNIAMSGCGHIIALHNGNITDDPRIETRDYRVTEEVYGQTTATYFARLTQLGQKMFYPRWVAKAL